MHMKIRPLYYQPTTANEDVLLHQNNVLFQENYKCSRNEQVLYNEWHKAIAEKKTPKRHDGRDATTYSRARKQTQNI